MAGKQQDFLQLATVKNKCITFAVEIKKEQIINYIKSKNYG